MSYTVTSNLKSSILFFELIPLKLPSFPKQTAFYKWNCWGKMRGVTLKMRHNSVMFRVLKKSLIFLYAFLSHIWFVCLILVTFLHFFFFLSFAFLLFLKGHSKHGHWQCQTSGRSNLENGATSTNSTSFKEL